MFPTGSGIGTFGPNSWHCQKLWNFQDMKSCWKKYITGSRHRAFIDLIHFQSGVCFLFMLGVWSLSFLFWSPNAVPPQSLYGRSLWNVKPKQALPFLSPPVFYHSNQNVTSTLGNIPFCVSTSHRIFLYLPTQNTKCFIKCFS